MHRSISGPHVLWSAQALTAAGVSSSSLEIEHFNELLIYVKVTAKSGTAPTIDLDVEVSHNDIDWHHHTDIAQIADPTLTYYAPVVKVTNFGKYVRLTVGTIAGAGASLTTTVTAIAKD